MAPVTLDDLKKVLALSKLPDEHLYWILDHSEYREYADGELVAKYGDPADVMWIALCGKVAFYMYINGRQVYYFTFENNQITGGIGGLIPYSRMKTYPGYSYAQGEVRLLRMHKDHFHALEQLNPDFIQQLIGYMTERARIFATTKLQQEKVEALGNLAAGIAHELNNPAAAIRGISDELGKRLSRNFVLTRDLLEIHIASAFLDSIGELVNQKEASQKERNKLSTLQRMQNEDELELWLEENGIFQREAAETFSEYGFSKEELGSMLEETGAEAFSRLIPWLENLISSRKIIQDLSDASCRISDLVGSIKSHVHMDQTNELQLTDIHQDIEHTLTLLGFKLRAKNISVKKLFSNLPSVPAYIGELNQVWTNLIDNAIGAMEKDGELIIETTQEEKEAIVSIIDNGAGIPEQILSRIFDPFFTTKKVGEGTGIGLDIVNRVVKRHHGKIKVTSQPGYTRFSVSIPLVSTPASA